MRDAIKTGTLEIFGIANQEICLAADPEPRLAATNYHWESTGYTRIETWSKFDKKVGSRAEMDKIWQQDGRGTVFTLGNWVEPRKKSWPFTVCLSWDTVLGARVLVTISLAGSLTDLS